MEESGQTRAARILPDFSDYEEAKALGILDEMLEGKKSIVILGHVNPDGDCIGSCLGLYNYLKENYEGLEVSVYLEKMTTQKHLTFASHRMPAMFRASVRSHLTGRRQRTRSVSTIISQTKVSAGSM